jgi:tRNA threonylcarbamoyladenosine biosynthesis protein TsaE
MQPIATRQWQTSSPEKTHALGVRLGQRALAGDFVACYGPLGAGKTVLIQGLAAGLGVEATAYVRSPTFTLLHEYPARIPIYHFDFYRISHNTEVQDIGFEEYLDAPGIVLVEWADKFPELLPANRLDLWISILPEEIRHIQGAVYEPAYVRYFGAIPEGTCLL